METIFNGNRIKFKLGRADFVSQYGSDSLIYFVSNEAGDMVVVDERADDTYVKYAAIHECICQGRCKHLAPEIADPNKRCGEIDKMIVAAMPETDRKTYVEKRIEMFETLLDQHLNPNLDPLFVESEKMMRELLDEMGR